MKGTKALYVTLSDDVDSATLAKYAVRAMDANPLYVSRVVFHYALDNSYYEVTRSNNTVSANSLCILAFTTGSHAEARRTRRRGGSPIFSASPRPPRLRVRSSVELRVHGESWELVSVGAEVRGGRQAGAAPPSK